MIIKKLLILCAMVIAFNVTAEEQGFYVGGGIGYSNIGYNEEAVVAAFRSNNISGSYSYETGDVAYKFYAGYNFNPNFGLEVGYMNLGEVVADITITTLLTNATFKLSSEVDGFFVAALGKYPFTEKSSFFGKVGFASYELNTETNVAGAPSLSDDDTGAFIGAGLEYGWGRLDLDHHFISGDIDNITSISFNLEYDF